MQLSDYTIGWICNSSGLASATVMLDSIDESHQYTGLVFGQVGTQNVVIGHTSDTQTSGLALTAQRVTSTCKKVQSLLILGTHDSAECSYSPGDIVAGYKKNSDGINISAAIEKLNKTEYTHKDFHVIWEKKPRLKTKYQHPHPESATDSKDSKIHPSEIQPGSNSGGNAIFSQFESMVNLMPEYAFLIIMGIFDATPSETAEKWQKHATMAAALYAKNVLENI